MAFGALRPEEGDDSECTGGQRLTSEVLDELLDDETYGIERPADGEVVLRRPAADPAGEPTVIRLVAQ
ncbi:hypothetical protein [Corynebacterium otitidis]|uniref:Uncharacterized protein n=1 Tax=Corynebacterium otitidis ATCC 51513 TaxID=883169 RepID=K0YF51_9CORY|nr:hypothetical protein [Corynebacterium otitidis]EJZ81788.1 hypothetical protein HMPREF9719_01305 [Corynebacterium otitidis ATCC 51513]KKO84253.1 hypothetical protein AAV33_02000 [Corynebacterium otitidis]